MADRKDVNRDIILAIIAVIGSVLTATIGNWDQISSHIWPRSVTVINEPERKLQTLPSQTPPAIKPDSAPSGESHQHHYSQINPAEHKVETPVSPVSQKPIIHPEIKIPPEPPIPTYEHAISLLNNQNVVEAVEEFKMLANKGDHKAEFQLSKIYVEGKGGIQVDKKQAFNWMNKAAMGNSPIAQHHLAVMYQAGLGVDKDEDLAVMWYQKAARKGYYPSRKVLSAGGYTW